MKSKKFQKANVLVSTIGLNELDWLQYRRAGIGGSDIGSIMGLSKYGSPLSVYLSKVEGSSSQAGRAAWYGKHMEGPVATEAALRLGLKSRKVPAILQHPDRPWMLANLDGYFPSIKAIHEIKNIMSRDAWGTLMKTREEGELIPFPDHELQVRWYMAVTGLKKGVITYSSPYGEPVDIFLDHDQVIEDGMIKAGEEFWAMVEAGIAPAMDGSDSADAFLQTRYRNSSNTTIDLDPSAQFLVDQYLRAREIREQQDKIMDIARQNLEKLLGENECGRTTTHVITWRPQETGRFDSKRFQQDHPKMYESYKKISSSRVFRLK